MPDEGYTIKEIVDATRREQTQGFTEVKVLLASKADKADLEPIHRKLDEHEGHIRALQDHVLVDATEEGSKSARATNIKWAIGVSSVIVATILATVLGHIFR